MPEDATQESGEQQDSECPVCGQAYDHKREEVSGTTRTGPKLRDDATVCKSRMVAGGKREVFVHVG